MCRTRARCQHVYRKGPQVTVRGHGKRAPNTGPPRTTPRGPGHALCTPIQGATVCHTPGLQHFSPSKKSVFLCKEPGAKMLERPSRFPCTWRWNPPALGTPGGHRAEYGRQRGCCDHRGASWPGAGAGTRWGQVLGGVAALLALSKGLLPGVPPGQCGAGGSAACPQPALAAASPKPIPAARRRAEKAIKESKTTACKTKHRPRGLITHRLQRLELIGLPGNRPYLGTLC